MPTIVIAAIGSRGDVAPITDVAQRLIERGHDVVIPAMAEFGVRDYLDQCGFRTLPLEFETGSGALDFVSPKGIRAMGNGLIDALVDQPADLLLLSPFAELAGHPLAEARGIPSVGVRMQPLSATAEFPPSLLGAWSAGATLNRLSSRVGSAALDGLYSGAVGGFRERLGLRERSIRTLRRERTAAEWPVLHGFSPLVVPRPADWRTGLDVTGYWWSQRPSDWQPPDDLVSFIRNGPPPVFVGLGSLILPEKARAQLGDVLRHAFDRAGVRAIVQSGWTGLEVGSDSVLTIGDVPHDWLFPQVAAVAHVCGAGTTAAGLRAGVPAIALPEPGADKTFWAKRLDSLGVSAATLSRRSLRPEQLSAAIDKALSDEELRANAASVAERLATEDGAGRAVEIIERALAQ